MEHTDIDLEHLEAECANLASIAFAAKTLHKYGQVEFTATLELIKENYEKVGKLLYPAPELGTLSV